MVNKQGLHARPISEMARVIGRYKATVRVLGPGGEADGRSVLQLMGLAAPQGSRLEFVADGEDARQLIDELCQLVSDGFGEP